MQNLSSAVRSGFCLALLAACSASPPRDPAQASSTDSEASEKPAESAGDDASEATPLAPASASVESDDRDSSPPRTEADEALEMPASCSATSSGLCTPPEAFVRAACKRSSVELALAMFKKSTPWTRAYLRLRTEAWYTGSRLAAPVQLELDEEVLIVADRGGGRAGQAQIVGASSYDVYRWDGKCASVMADEVTLRRPSMPRAAPIPWRRLGDETRAMLLKSSDIKLRQTLARERCSEDSSALRCTEATDALTQQIAGYVRRGGKLADPELVLR